MSVASTDCVANDMVYQEVPAESEAKNEDEIVELMTVAVLEEECDDKVELFDLEKGDAEKSASSADESKNETSLGRWLKKLGFNFEENDYSDVNVPELSYWQIFKIFFWFGCRAFGGNLCIDKNLNISISFLFFIFSLFVCVCNLLIIVIMYIM